MNNSKQQIIEVSSAVRPTFTDLPGIGTSQWYAIYAGFDTNVSLIGLNNVTLKLSATSKEIRYNLKRVLIREDGKYTEIVGSGTLNPMKRGPGKVYNWGPKALAGLPIVALDVESKYKKEHLKGAFLGMLQIETTHINPTNSQIPELTTEALNIELSVKSIVTGELSRSEFQGHIFVLPTPPPTAFEGYAGDFLTGADVCMTVIADDSTALVEFPESHFNLSNTQAGNPFFVYYDKDIGERIIPEINHEALWGCYYKLPTGYGPMMLSIYDETHSAKTNDLYPCAYMRIGMLTEASGSIPSGTYVGVPQPLNADPKIATSMCCNTMNGLAMIYGGSDDATGTMLIPANSTFTFEGLSPSTNSADLMVDGVSIIMRKGGRFSYEIQRFASRQLANSKATLINMPDPKAQEFGAGFPSEVLTEYGIPLETLCKTRRVVDMRTGSWFTTFIKGVVAVTKLIYDVAESGALASLLSDDEKAGPYKMVLEELKLLEAEEKKKEFLIL